MATMKNMVAMIPLELTEQTRKILVLSTCCQISLQTTSKDTFILDLSIIIDQPLHTLVLNIGKNLVVMSQTESKLNAAYGPVLRKDAQMTFTAETGALSMLGLELCQMRTCFYENLYIFGVERFLCFSGLL